MTLAGAAQTRGFNPCIFLGPSRAPCPCTLGTHLPHGQRLGALERAKKRIINNNKKKNQIKGQAMLSWKNTKCREQQSRSITITAPAAGEGSANCFGLLPARSPTGDNTAPAPRSPEPRGEPAAPALPTNSVRARGSAERSRAPGRRLALGKILAVPTGPDPDTPHPPAPTLCVPFPAHVRRGHAKPVGTRMGLSFLLALGPEPGSSPQQQRGRREWRGFHIMYIAPCCLVYRQR